MKKKKTELYVVAIVLGVILMIAGDYIDEKALFNFSGIYLFAIGAVIVIAVVIEMIIMRKIGQKND